MAVNVPRGLADLDDVEPTAPTDSQVLTFDAGTSKWVPATPAGGGWSGTVTGVSVTAANGFDAAVTSPTTHPTIVLRTSVTGIAKGDGTALSAAVPGTDYLAPDGSGARLTGILPDQAGNRGSFSPRTAPRAWADAGGAGGRERRGARGPTPVQQRRGLRGGGRTGLRRLGGPPHGQRAHGRRHPASGERRCRAERGPPGVGPRRDDGRLRHTTGSSRPSVTTGRGAS